MTEEQLSCTAQQGKGFREMDVQSKTIELDKVKAVEIRDALQYMHDRLFVEPGAILGLANHLTELSSSPT